MKNEDQVILREGSWSVPFRGVSEEDVLPPLAPELTPRSYKVYPYSLQELYHPEHVGKSFRTLTLENRFLKLELIPELGGRMLAFDKKAGRDLFFRNRELTPVMAGLTGAWMRLGCEFNFPGSHSVTSNRPVGAVLRKNSDGSGSIIFSDIEWCSGMEWKIELVLFPNSPVIRQISTFYNRTQVHNRGYFWTNAKVEAPRDSEFIFPSGTRKGMIHPPMDVTRIHEFDLPGDNGVDLRANRNVCYPLPLFFKDLRTPFFGCYNRDEDAGLMHYAACGDLPGRKVWTPGVGDDAKPTAQGGPDTFELQSGPLPLQTDFFYLEPGRSTTWSECWIAFSGIGKVYLASPDALAAERDGRHYLYALRDLKAVRGDNFEIAELASGGKAELPGEVTGIVTAENVPILLPVREHVVFPEYPEAEAMPEETAEALVQKAIYKFSRGENAAARSYCEAALKIDSGESQALLLLAIDALKCGEPAKAAELCRSAKKRNRRDPMIDYYLGLALKRSGNSCEAEFFLERAMQSITCRNVALEVWAELLIAEGRGAEAESRIRFLLCGADGRFCVREENLRLLELLLARNQNSAELRAAVEALSPNDLLLRTEGGIFSGNSRQQLQLILDLRRWGVDSSRWEKSFLASWPEDPVGNYLFGGEAGFQRAETLSPAGVFPDSEEVFQLLNQLYRKHPEAQLLPYYLGVLAASFEAWEEAEEFWKKSSAPEALRGLGLSALHRKDYPAAAEYYVAGFRKQSGLVSYKFFYEMMLALRGAGDRTRRAEILSQLPETLKNYPQVQLAKFQYLYDCGRHEELLQLLAGGRFTLYEGRRDTVNLFIGSHLVLGDREAESGHWEAALGHYRAALSYPLNLGVGRSVGRTDMKIKYKLCKTLQAAGRNEEAAATAAGYLAEIKKYAYSYVPLKTIRYEEDKLFDDVLMRENLDYQARLEKEFPL